MSLPLLSLCIKSFFNPQDIFSELLRGQGQHKLDDLDGLFSGREDREMKLPNSSPIKADVPEPEAVERPLALTVEELF